LQTDTTGATTITDPPEIQTSDIDLAAVAIGILALVIGGLIIAYWSKVKGAIKAVT